MDEETGPPEARRADVGVMVRTFAAWALGMSGMWASARGWGGVVMFGPVQGEALRMVGGVTFIGAAGGWALRRWPLASAALWVAISALAMVVAAPNAGRSFGLAAAVSVAAAFAGLVGMSLWSRTTRSANPVAWPAVALVAAGQLGWGFTGAAWIAVLLSIGAFAAATHHDRDPGVSAAIVRHSQRMSGRVTGAVASAVNTGGESIALRAGRLARGVRSSGLLGPTVLAAAISLLLVVPILHRFATAPPTADLVSDFAPHIGHAATTSIIPLSITTPFAYPAFHVLTSLVSGLTGDVATAATVVLALAVALTAVILVWSCTLPMGERPAPGPRVGAAYAIALLVLETPLLISHMLRVGNPYDWAPTNHIYNSPTDVLVLPMALLLVVVIGRAIGTSTPGAWSRRWTGLLAALAMLSKPSMSMALVPAIPAMMIRRKRVRDVAGFVLRAFYIPTAIVFAWQVWYVASDPQRPGAVSVSIDPLATVRIASLDRVSLFFFAPAAATLGLCLWAGGRRFLRDPVVSLSMWCMGWSFVPLLLLAESGDRAADATFVKPATISWVVLNLVSWRFLAGEAVARWRDREIETLPRWIPVAAVWLVIGLVAGVVAYLEWVGVLQLPVRRTGA
jgi:hypothetical protein